MDTKSVLSTPSVEGVLEATPANARLLIVEDEEDIAHVLAVALGMAGYQVTTVGGLTEAQKHLTENEVNLVITDWMLTDGTGTEVCQAARSKDSQMPIIVISAVIGRWDMRLVKCHSDAYLKKPLDISTLRLTVARLLRLRAPVQAATASGETGSEAGGS